jgi:formate C-acetyltransferase
VYGEVYGVNERVARLRKDFLESERKVNIERALIITEVYREHEEKPAILKRAFALEAILSRMTIAIRDDEIIVGNQTLDRRGAPLFPENAVEWILDQMDSFPTRTGDRFQITEEEKRALREALPYWKGRTLRDKVRGSLPPFLKEMLNHGVFTNENYTMSGPGHMVPDYEAVLRRGLKEIAEGCRTSAESLDPGALDYIDRFHLYQACALTCEAVIKFARRYAEEAERQAAGEKNEARRQELLWIADHCRRVPGLPARDFWEALQSIYLVQVALQIETNGLSVALGRMDQLLHDYYRKDITDGRLTREQALELLVCFYLKLSEIDKVYSNEATRYLQGPSQGQTITLGGVTPDGKDATNDLTFLFLEADRHVRLVQPDLALRVHRTTSEELLREVSINIREGLTKPKLFNDEVIIQTLLTLGMPLEDARDWAALGCSEPVVPGKTNSGGNMGILNLAKCLELGLNEGKCMLTEKTMGPATEHPARFDSFDQVLEAFRDQVRHFVRNLVLYDNIIDRAHAVEVPQPLYSIVTRDCLAKGVEFNRGGAVYNTTSPLGVGPISTGDSLAAIRTLVYEEKRLTLGELVEALRSNFEGREDLRQMLINRAPKFGNDDDRADDLCNTVLKIFCDELNRYRNPRGGLFVGALYYLTSNIPFGKRTAASADGRKAGEPLNDGGISPVHGRDRRGATAVARSVGKLDIQRVHHGSVLNQRFHPSLFSTGDGGKRFTDYLRTFMDLGGWHTQFNVITTETLRKAQKTPEQYRDLVIRVAGYSAYFTQLEEELQNDIIERTEMIAY